MSFLLFQIVYVAGIQARRLKRVNNSKHFACKTDKVCLLMAAEMPQEKPGFPCRVP